MTLAVFIFVMTGVVYETQSSHNKQIVNYADALYFTATALTTTGFDDITLPGTAGRLITVVIMIFGVTLFLNLAKALLAPPRCDSRARSADCNARWRRSALQGVWHGIEHSRRRHGLRNGSQKFR